MIDANNPTGYAQVLEAWEDLNTNGVRDTGEVTSFVLGHDVISQFQAASATLHYLLYDGHGSTRGLVDAMGQPLDGQIYAYDAFGNRLSGTGLVTGTPLTSLLYSGEQTDSTGLQYLRARYYDSQTGRFNRLDPFAGKESDPLSLHKYLYVHGDPLNTIDPSGLFGLAGFAAGFGIANSIRSIHTEAVLSAYDAALTTISGIQAGQNAQQIVSSFVSNQVLGFGIGLITGKVLDVAAAVGGKIANGAAAIWEHGITVAISRLGRSRSALTIINNSAFRLARSAIDIAVTGRRAPRIIRASSSRVRKAFRTSIQQQRAQVWVNWANSNGAIGLRINQTQVSTGNTRLGVNRPDLQFTLPAGQSYTLPNGAVISLPQGSNRRIYVELDAVSSNRGPGHFRRIMANDPEGFVILETNSANGIIGSLTVP